jgi:hypothetical protein
LSCAEERIDTWNTDRRSIPKPDYRVRRAILSGMTVAAENENKKPAPWYRDWWPLLIVGPFSAAAVTLYALQFSDFGSGKQEHWGQFGDYVGGVLNPFVALFALIMLIVSVRVQRAELEDTREELKRARDVAHRQLFESQFFGTLRLLISVTANVKATSGHADFVRIMGQAVGQSTPFLEELATFLEQQRERHAPLIALVKIMTNALNQAEQILSSSEVEYYSATLRGFVSDYEAGVLLGAMHRDPVGAPLELAVEKFRLIQGIRRPTKEGLWGAGDRPNTLVNRLPSNLNPAA